MTVQPDYHAFLEAKVRLAGSSGFAVDPGELSHPWIRPHVARAISWMLAGGRRAVFASFGLHKTTMQLVAGDRTLKRLPAPARGLIVAPLGVRREFMRDAAQLGIKITFVRSLVECAGPGLYLTNYETARENKLPAELFGFVSLDEAAVLRGMGGTKAFRAFMNDGWRDVPYRFVATATPSPNDYIELLAYAAFLGVMDVGEAKTRFFRRDSTKADALTLHPHKEAEFWLWVASWALFITRPSDITGDEADDEGYRLPPMTVTWHEVKVDHREARAEKSGQGVMFRNASLGVVEAAAEKRTTIHARLSKVAGLLAERPAEHALVWHDLEAERAILEAACPDMATVYGSQDLEAREEIVGAFADGFVARLGAKPSMLGAGTNLQRHCRWAIFAGVSSKFHDFIQAIHRLLRFGQEREVWIDIVHSESQREEVENLRRKWRQHETMVAKMTAIIREFGLSEAAMASALTRSLFEPEHRIEVSEASPSPRYVLARNDCVYETRAMAEGSVQLIVSSIPFGTQYEYSPSYNDLGHTDDADHFWRQMDFLVPQLLRILEPGRVAAIHVKDRIVPGGLTGLGFQTVYPFADDCRACFRKHGFAYLGEKTNLTDVVRENNQTYRLGWSEQLKDGSRMGAGLPEKVLLFRRPPSDSSSGYADRPVGKPRPDFVDRAGEPAAYSTKRSDIRPVVGTGYSRGRWQLDAHHLTRASGDRLLTTSDWASWDKLAEVRRLWERFNLTQWYDFEHHVRICEDLDAMGKLPPTFMLLPPFSWHPDVWTDVAQMLSANTLQAAAGREMHLCPMPFDIADRLIVQFSEPGDMVFDPFMGIGTTPMRAIKLGRRGSGCELNGDYFLDACKIVEATAREMATPSLFDLMGIREEAAA
ncbi:MAG TPA: DNA methyltransferase [Caulobacteraceae bacterium]|jgi:hypothetical protein